MVAIEGRGMKRFLELVDEFFWPTFLAFIIVASLVVGILGAILSIVAAVILFLKGSGL